MTAAQAMPYVLIGAAVLAVLLVIALGANRELARENRGKSAVIRQQATSLARVKWERDRAREQALRERPVSVRLTADTSGFTEGLAQVDLLARNEAARFDADVADWGGGT